MSINNNLLDVIPTKASLLNRNKVKEFKAVVFEEKKPKQKLTNSVSKVDKTIIERNMKDSETNLDSIGMEISRRKKRKTDDTEFDIKKAKHEIINFAISGSNLKDKKAAQVALAIKLGAKPPKQDYKNYKELLQEKKIKNEEKEQAAKFSLLGKNQYGASITKCNKKPRKIISEISKHYGVVNPKLKKKKLIK